MPGVAIWGDILPARLQWLDRILFCVDTNTLAEVNGLQEFLIQDAEYVLIIRCVEVVTTKLLASGVQEGALETSLYGIFTDTQNFEASWTAAVFRDNGWVRWEDRSIFNVCGLRGNSDYPRRLGPTPSIREGMAAQHASHANC